MAQVNLTEFFPGDAFDATAINAAMSSWVTQSTNIDETNVREEGITRRVIADGAVAPSDMRGATSDAGTLSRAVSATPTMLLDSGGGVIKVGPLDYSDLSDRIVVRMSCRFDIDLDTSGSKQPTLNLSLRYGRFANSAAADASVAGDWTLITGSQREHEFVHSPVTGAILYDLQERNCCTIAVRNDQLSTSASDYWYCIFYSLDDPGGAPSVDFMDIQLSVMSYVK